MNPPNYVISIAGMVKTDFLKSIESKMIYIIITCFHLISGLLILCITFVLCIII